MQSDINGTILSLFIAVANSAGLAGIMQYQVNAFLSLVLHRLTPFIVGLGRHHPDKLHYPARHKPDDR